MKRRLLQALNWIRLIDENGLLSLTNVAVVVVVVKVALSEVLDLTAAAMLLTTLSAYNFKRWSGSKNKALVNDITAEALERLLALEADMTRLKVANGIQIREDSRESA